MIRYTVACRFTGNNQQVANQWLEWLRKKHLQDVLDAGAQSAELIQVDDEVPHYLIDYRFATRSELERYLAESAPRLRAEGLERFPLELGLEYQRSTGTALHSLPPR
jgi:hypothetical protein